MCYFGERAGKRANSFIVFRRFAPLSRAFFCPAPQSLTSTAREKLGWEPSSLPLEIAFSPARGEAVSAAAAQLPVAQRVPHPGGERFLVSKLFPAAEGAAAPVG